MVGSRITKCWYWHAPCHHTVATFAWLHWVAVTWQIGLHFSWTLNFMRLLMVDCIPECAILKFLMYWLNSMDSPYLDLVRTHWKTSRNTSLGHDKRMVLYASQKVGWMRLRKRSLSAEFMVFLSLKIFWHTIKLTRWQRIGRHLGFCCRWELVLDLLCLSDTVLQCGLHRVLEGDIYMIDWREASCIHVTGHMSWDQGIK